MAISIGCCGAGFRVRDASGRHPGPAVSRCKPTPAAAARSWDYLSESEPPRHTLQTKTKAMAAQTHNPTPATAQDTPIYAKVTINATQASTRKILIGHPYEETPHQRRDDPTCKDCPGTGPGFAPIR